MGWMIDVRELICFDWRESRVFLDDANGIMIGFVYWFDIGGEMTKSISSNTYFFIDSMYFVCKYPGILFSVKKCGL